MVKSLVIDGIFTGVGSVLSFLPVILILFFFLSILEDTGYMARIAFVMDTFLRKIGLSGRSFVPMLLGFGCSVPAVMASRTLSSERDRNLTIMLIPFISCSAKIPIYTVFTAAFFPHRGVLVMSCLYFGGICNWNFDGIIFKKVLFAGKPMPFVMELPNYRFPSLKSVLLLMWEKARDFLERAFTIIFLASMIIWFLQTFDSRLNVVTDSANSLPRHTWPFTCTNLQTTWIRRLENFYCPCNWNHSKRSSSIHTQRIIRNQCSPCICRLSVLYLPFVLQ